MCYKNCYLLLNQIYVKDRWHYPATPRDLCRVILATAVLHNLAIQLRLSVPEDEDEDKDDMQPAVQPAPTQPHLHQAVQPAPLLWNDIRAYFFQQC